MTPIDISADPSVQVLVDRLIDVRTLSEIADLSIETIRRMVNAGTFPKPLRLGRHMRWRAADYNRWVEDRLKQQNGAGKPKRGAR